MEHLLEDVQQRRADMGLLCQAERGPQVLRREVGLLGRAGQWSWRLREGEPELVGSLRCWRGHGDPPGRWWQTTVSG